MARPLRIEFAGALYHVTTRGDRREAVFEDDEDRRMFLSTLAEVVERFNWICHAYCLMTNHYHLVVETPDANLSKGMRLLNGVYTQASNRRHGRVGHLFQGRFKGILVDKDNHMLELARYVVLNPVRAGLVAQPGDWPWSSYRAVVGEEAPPKWLATTVVLAQFGGTRPVARNRYRNFVAAGHSTDSVWANLRQQIYLGNEAFVEQSQAKAKVEGDELSIPQVQRRAPAPSLEVIAGRHSERNTAIAAAYATGAYSYREIAEYFGLHLATIGRVIRKQMLQGEN
ncbi:MAG: transposase [Gammaproteobacteria bacterium]|nr:transposase [Gammaproteobacteria bacterium]